MPHGCCPVTCDAAVGSSIIQPRVHTLRDFRMILVVQNISSAHVRLQYSSGEGLRGLSALSQESSLVRL